MAAGDAFTLDLYGDQLVSLAVAGTIARQIVGENGEPLGALVTNSGRIIADGGSVVLSVMAAQGIVDNVINMSGIIQANSVGEQNGQIVLMGGDAGIVAVSGTLEASGDDAGETGGTVHVLGEKVGLFAGANVDVSGDVGGGTVLIGGDFQGGGSVPPARRTYVSADATIDASAGTSGDGGTAIVWAEEITRFYGRIVATGGAECGDGGFAEVSGKGSLTYGGSTDLTAADGVAGTLLLDPKNIVVVTAGAETTDLADVDEFADPNIGGQDTKIAPATIVTGLNTANVVLQANNNITVTDAIDASGNAGSFSLTMQAGDNIIVNADIKTNNGAISLTANDAGSSDANSGADGVFSQADGTTIDAGNQTITISSQGDVALGTSTTTSAVFVTSTEGDIDEDGNNTTDNIVGASSVALTAADGIGIGSTLDLGGVTNLTLDAADDIDVSTSGVLTDLTLMVDPGAGNGITYTVVDNGAGTANLTFTLTDAGADLSVTNVSVAAGNLNFSLTSATAFSRTSGHGR